MKIAEKLIAGVVKTIVKNFKPEMIILFGSHARGEATPDSDLDILVIKESDLRRDLRATEIDNLFAKRMFPMDIVVYTPDEVRRLKDLEGSFIKDILENGEILYEKAA